MLRHDTLLPLASRQLGLVSRAQALDLGVDRHAVRDLCSSGRWELATPRVLRLRGSPPSRGQRPLLAVLDAGGDTVLSHSTAAAWWGVPGFTLREVHVVRSSKSTHRSDLAALHRVRWLPGEWCTVHDSIPIVRPELCVLQLSATEHPKKAERALDNLWKLRLLSGPSLLAFIAAMGRRGRDGTTLFRQLVDARGPGYIQPASNLERRFDDILERHGLPRMEREVDAGGDRWTGRVDRFDRDLGLIVEIQSEAHHTSLVDAATDAVRIADLRAAGFEVLEITDELIWNEPDLVAARVRATRIAASVPSAVRQAPA